MKERDWIPDRDWGGGRRGEGSVPILRRCQDRGDWHGKGHVPAGKYKEQVRPRPQSKVLDRGPSYKSVPPVGP